MSKAGLVPVQKLVIRHGQQFMTTVYVNPNKTNKVDKTKHVQIPAWNFTTAADMEAEKNKIVKTKDPAEKEVLKQHFLEHLESIGVKWQKNSNEAINFMRALMAAKDHLSVQGNVTPSQPSQPAPQPTPQPQAATSSTGGSPMSKDDAKKLIKDLQKKDSVDNIMAQMKSEGITWNEHAKPAVNKMRAMMALNAHFQKGGTLGGGNAQPAAQPQPAAPKPDPKKPVIVPAKGTPGGPKVGTIEHDYHSATDKGKAIGLLTGMVPKGKDAEDFLHRLIMDGKMDVDPSNSQAGPKSDYGLPKGMEHHLVNGGRIDREIQDDDFGGYARPNSTSQNFFENSPMKKHFEDYKKNTQDYRNTYGQDIMDINLSYTKTITKNLDMMDMNGMHVDTGKSGEDYYADFKTLLADIKNSKDIDKKWDELGFDDFLNRESFASRNKNYSNPPIQQMLEFAFGGAFSEVEDVKRNFVQQCGQNGWNSVKTVLNQVNNGSLTKTQVIENLEKAIGNDMTVKVLRTKNHWRQPLIPNMMDQSNLSYWGHSELPRCDDFFKQMNLNQVKDGQATMQFNRSKFDNFVAGSITEKAKLTTPEAKWVKHNLILYNTLHAASNDSYYGKFKMPENWEPIDFNDWASSSDKMDCFRRHTAIMRKSVNTRDKWRKKYTPDKPKTNLDKQQLFDALKNATPDFSSIQLPTHKELGKGAVKCALEKVPQAEQDTVNSKIQATHDKQGHSSFRTKVHAVYRITNLPYEEKFQEIDKDRNHTGFYYHGTDYRAAQKILGASGQFVVNKTNVKAGRMLGDGVYLAAQSSKSMQYISSGFNRGIGNRGALFLCKASLGNTVESTTRGSQYNTKLLAQKGVDTVFMDKPHVVNPEWAVKEEKAVIPRLMIDVEMVNA